MTATETIAPPANADTWTAEMAQLRSRYKTVREPILAALNLLLQDPDITDSDAKAVAATRGIRITAASISVRSQLAGQGRRRTGRHHDARGGHHGLVDHLGTAAPCSTHSSR